MAQKRARLTEENNPLKTKTDDFLVGLEQGNQPTTQEVSKPTIQPATLRKATFKLSETVLRKLDNYHLQLQLELGKADAPYKEVIVEEAICRLLGQVGLNSGEVLAALQARQESRD